MVESIVRISSVLLFEWDTNDHRSYQESLSSRSRLFISFLAISEGFHHPQIYCSKSIVGLFLPFYSSHTYIQVCWAHVRENTDGGDAVTVVLCWRAKWSLKTFIESLIVLPVVFYPEWFPDCINVFLIEQILKELSPLRRMFDSETQCFST